MPLKRSSLGLCPTHHRARPYCTHPQRYLQSPYRCLRHQSPRGRERPLWTSEEASRSNPQSPLAITLVGTSPDPYPLTLLRLSGATSNWLWPCTTTRATVRKVLGLERCQYNALWPSCCRTSVDHGTAAFDVAAQARLTNAAWLKPYSQAKQLAERGSDNQVVWVSATCPKPGRSP